MSSEAKASKTKDTPKPLWREYGEALCWALVLALLVRTFVIQSFKIPSESMLETLQVGDFLFATKFEYGIRIPFTNTYITKGREPERGEIIIFEYPRDPSMDFIKRIIGVPGDVIEVRSKQLYRNGQMVEESYIRHSDPHHIENIRDKFGPVTVPEGKFFVMGDNRDNSMDSRYWGFVDRSAIKARAWRIYFSLASLADIRWNRLGQLIE